MKKFTGGRGGRQAENTDGARDRQVKRSYLHGSWAVHTAGELFGRTAWLANTLLSQMRKLWPQEGK